eukprot:TRINITY_DN14855_c0_g1_i1.p1 TRINITY_DN14855_c0_g1~~TRINITY_DN14855_c0_g1_i1.p1  ORF type:complete len:415 (+),score=38.15 TRINITY_DN14855_c0_g1_i1:62-1306(+)
MLSLLVVFFCLAVCQNPPVLNDNTTCIEYGYNDATRYRSVVVLPNLYGSSFQGKVFLPIYSSQDLGEYDSTVISAVITIHGLLRNANTYFCQSMHAFQGTQKTIVVAPWFADTIVTGDYWNSSNSIGSMRGVFWSNDRWAEGGDNSPDPARYISAFDCLDVLLAAFDPSIFPNLQQIILTGFSAGGQLVSRYAFFSQLSAKFPVRLIVSDPSTYMYFDNTRPIASCIPLTPTPTSWTCPTFEVPTDGLCPNFNDYKFGLDNLGSSSNLYVENLSGSDIDQLLNDYTSKDVRWIFGDGDVCNCQTDGYDNPSSCFPSGQTCYNSGQPTSCCDTYPDSKRDNVLDVDCESMYEGSNRLQRGLNFISYLQAYYSNYNPLFAFYSGQHDNYALITSSTYKSWCDVSQTMFRTKGHVLN